MVSKNKENISGRKAKHIAICVEEQFSVEKVGANEFAGLRFLHNPLPELSFDDINTEVSFLDHQLSLPFFISCMTGGSADGHKANKHLARAAQNAGISVGLGSIRVLFEHEELFPHFHIKKLAPDVPVLANIGVVQIRDIPHQAIIEMVKKLEVQALVIHLNPGQELFQPDGDRDFRNLREALAFFRETAPFPCIVKETGFGIPPRTVKDLKKIGMDYIDVAGNGGTNWISVESYRFEKNEYPPAREFEDWGYPTPFLLELLKNQKKILASGGLRTGTDLAKSIALGAELGGMALPFIRAVINDGEEGAGQLINQIEKSLKAVMLLTGSENISMLKQVSLWRTPAYSQSLKNLKKLLKNKNSNHKPLTT